MSDPLVKRRRLRGLYLVKMYDGLGKFVGGTRISFEEPVEKNMRAYVDKWAKLNPWARVKRFTAKREGIVDETGRN